MNKLLFLLFSIFMVSCVGKTQTPVVVKIEITATFPPTVTSPKANPPTPTQTYIPTSTFTLKPTNTFRPTSTRTETLTPTPFITANCKELRLDITDKTTIEQVNDQLVTFENICIKAYYRKNALADEYLEEMNNNETVEIKLRTDKSTIPGIKPPTEYSIVYGTLMSLGSNIWKPRVFKLISVEEVPANLRPIFREGLYRVGQEGDMAPGQWKSKVSPTTTNNCYWARINPNTGDIKDNHFGIGGMTVRLYEGEIFETNSNCTGWYYLGP